MPGVSASHVTLVAASHTGHRPSRQQDPQGRVATTPVASRSPSPGAQKGTRMIKGFKDFLMRGNVVDHAVAVVIGTAFAKVVDSFVIVIVAAAVYVVVGVPMNHLAARRRAGVEPEPVAPSEQVMLLTEVRDSLRA